jgi:hypothetical protein
VLAVQRASTVSRPPAPGYPLRRARSGRQTSQARAAFDCGACLRSGRPEYGASLGPAVAAMHDPRDVVVADLYSPGHGDAVAGGRHDAVGLPVDRIAQAGGGGEDHRRGRVAVAAVGLDGGDW